MLTAPCFRSSPRKFLTMLRRILLPTIFVILGYGFWISPDFKTIAAGVSIFLFGMLSLEQGFQAFAGGTLERILKNTTDKLWKSLSFGIVSTTLMQSSSLVSVITIFCRAMRGRPCRLWTRYTKTLTRNLVQTSSFHCNRKKKPRSDNHLISPYKELA